MQNQEYLKLINNRYANNKKPSNAGWGLGLRFRHFFKTYFVIFEIFVVFFNIIFKYF